VDGNRRKVVFQGPRQGAVALVRQEDGLAIGGKECPQPRSGGNLRQAGKLALQFLAVDLAKIGDSAFAQMGEFGVGEDVSRFTISHDSLLIAGRPE
jgi:hypothetical protein